MGGPLAVPHSKSCFDWTDTVGHCISLVGYNNHQRIAKMDFFNGAQAIYTNMRVRNPNLRSKIASDDEID